MNAVDVPFYRRVEDALGKTRMRHAVLHTSGRAMESRRAAIAELDSSDAVRDQARAIRSRTLSELDRHLDTFVTNVEKNGGTVFFAETGDDAVAYIRRLARDRGVKSIVKGKSMVSEEIELNPMLEADGIEVVETDLGEFIVQLDNDKPSHIVAPILHKTKEDCARVFQEKLGATDEEVAGVPQMTQLARRVLRQAFLKADMGITGVNFGVAETGSICICTNEGNGRLSTSLPRIHVAMMGMERLVPTAADLGVMLEVLGAQRHRPAPDGLHEHPQRPAAARRGGRPRGVPRRPPRQRPQRGAGQRAGRDPLLHPLRRLPQRLPGLPADRRPRLRQRLLRPGRSGAHALPWRASAPSTICRTPARSAASCKEVCPVRIDIPRMLLRLRAQGVEAGESPQWVTLGIKVLGWIGTRPRLFGLAGRVAARLAGRLATDGWISDLPLHLSGWTQSRDFPAPAVESFQEGWARRHGPSSPDRNGS